MDVDSLVDELLASGDDDAATERRRTELLLAIAKHPTGSWVERLRAHEHAPFWVESADDFAVGSALLPGAPFAVDLDEADDDALSELLRFALGPVVFLYLESRQLSAALAARLAAAAPPIEYLRLDGPGAPDVIHALMPLLVMTAELHLHDGAIDEPTFVELVGRLMATRELSVDGCAIGANGIEALAASECGFRALDLARTAVDHECVERLCRSSLPLETLDLTETASGDQGAAAIGAAPFAQTLRALSLAHTGLTDAGAIAITSTELPRLRRLNLSGNPRIGLRGLKAIATSPHVGDIDDLDLTDNGFVSREQVRLLAESPSLHPAVRDEWRGTLASLRS